MIDKPTFFPFNDTLITPAHIQSVGLDMTNTRVGQQPASAAWPTASMAIYIPFSTGRTMTVYQLGWVNGATSVAGNADAGIYRADGTRVISAGATARTGAVSTLQLANVTDTILYPGQYYLALVHDGTGNMFRWTDLAPLPAMKGVLTQASAYPLPTPSATFAQNYTNVTIPVVCAVMRPTI